MKLTLLRCWQLKNKRQELARLVERFRSVADRPGETTWQAGEHMYQLFLRIEDIKADIKKLRTGK